MNIEKATNKELLEKYKEQCQHNGAQYQFDIKMWKEIEQEILERMSKN